MGSQQKKKKRTEDSRSLSSEIKRTQDLDVNKLALQPTFELGYSPGGVGTVSFVNVSTSLAPAQGSSGSPAQVTGLTVTPQGGSDTQLNLAWTTTTLPAEFNYYNVYRATTSGFIVGPSFKIAQPVTNSYNNTSLIPGTTYYYRVSTTNDAELEGAPSSQVSGTTTGTAPVSPIFLLHLDNNFTDSANGQAPWNIQNSNGFGTPGKFGTHYWKINYPTNGTNEDVIVYNPLPPLLQMDTTVGFSYSLWIFPQDISTLSSRRVIIEENNDQGPMNNGWSLQIDSTGAVHFLVRKAGASVKRQITGITTGVWYHIAAVYDAVANTVRLYKNGVEGATSSVSNEYPTQSPSWVCGARGGDGTNTRFRGYIDEIQHFKGNVLSSTQVTNLMNNNTT